MRPSYLVAASLAASVALSPVLASAADTGAKSVKPAAASQAVPPAPGLSAAASEKIGCGAVLMILGKVADGYPDLFAKENNGKAIQIVLSAFGLKGKVMMDEGFAEGDAQGLTPTQTYEAGVTQVLQLIKPAAGAKAEDVGREAGVALMQRCTGITAD